MTALALASAPTGRRAPDLPLVAALGLLLFALGQVSSLGELWRNLAVPDNDDALRLVGVRDLLAGQPWFDTRQLRYLPPEGADLHWSRLVDAPLAALVALLRPLLGQEGAERVVVILWPPALFLAYLVLVVSAVRSRFGREAALLAALSAGLMPTLASMFGVGRIDHHNVQILLVAGVIVAGVRASPRSSAISGACAAASLAVGLETLPFVALAGALHVLAWAAEGEAARARLSAFGVALGLGSLLLFGFQTGPDRWAVPACDALSPAWLVLTLGGSLGTLALAGAGARLRTGPLRVGAGLLLGAVLATAFGLLSPHCLAGPYAGLSEEIRTYWLSQVSEAMPLPVSLSKRPEFTLASSGPILAALLAALALARAPEHRRLGIAVGAAAGLALALSLVQVRALVIGAAVVPLAAGPALAALLARARGDGPFARRLAAALAMMLFFSQSWTMLAWTTQAADAPRLISAPAGPSCTAPAAVRALDALPAATILADIDLGARILQFTRHRIVAAPYHRNVEGLSAGIEAFRGDEGAVREVMRRHGATVLVVCRGFLSAYGPGPSLARELAEGRAPGWLTRVDIAAGPLQVWRIDPPASPP